MKFRLSLIVVICALAAACVQRPEPAPVTGWNPGSSTAAMTIRVVRGDTLSGIAHRYGVSSRAIIEANHLASPYWLEVGQVLVLPRTTAPDAPSYAAAAPAPPANDRWQRPPASPSKTAEASLAQSTSDAPRIDSPEVPPSERRWPRLAEATPVKPPTSVHPAAVAVVPPRDAAPPTQIGSRGFIWPVRGRIVEGFGAGRNGTQNDGLNIAARPGAPVYAAAAGEVVYVGNELRGYGNLVLIKHEGGYLTAYAHNSTLLVHKGEHVARGQTIARVGASGEVGEPQLHFEIRVGRNPVDPMHYLPPEQQASIGE